MSCPDAKQDVQFILSWFSGAFSNPSFKLFCSFVLGFIQLGKEPHTSSMVQCLAQSFLQRSLSSFTRFLANPVWSLEEIREVALDKFFLTLKIKARSVVFLLLDDTILEKTGKKIPGCSWYKDHARNLASVFGHQWVISALLYKQALLPLVARLYHSQGTAGCGRFQTKTALAKKILQGLRLPIPCKLYLLADGWYWSKELAHACRQHGYHMISQLKSNSVLWIRGKRTRVTELEYSPSFFRQVSVLLYGKNKSLKIGKFIGLIKGLGPVALIVVKERRKKTRYLVCTNLLLPALEVVKFYSHRWKIEQMIKDLKQRLGLGDYQMRDLRAIHRHVALAFLSYFILVLLKILQWLKDHANVSLHSSIRFWASLLRKHILLERITVQLKTMKVQFTQNVLDTYFEKLWA